MASTETIASVDQTSPRPHVEPLSKPPCLRVALAQVAPYLGDFRRNYDMHLRLIDQAAQAGADAVIFPELSLTGYFLRDMVADVALPADSPEIAGLVKAAGPMALVAGLVEQSPQHRFFNSGFYAESGRVVYMHRKVYLPTYGLFDEQRYFARGDRMRAFDTQKMGRVGILICEDLWHISAVAIMQAEEVDCLICISNSPARGVQRDTVATSETYERMCRTYAQLLGAVVILVNRVGFEDGLCFWGGSMVVGPDGELIARAPHLDESLTLADIDPLLMRRQRLTNPLARDERLLLTVEELTRIKRRRYAD